MPNLGPVELLVILVVFAIIALVVVALVLLVVWLARGPRPPGRPGDLDRRARALKRSGHVERAVMLVRGETGMSHDEAARYVHDL